MSSNPSTISPSGGNDADIKGKALVADDERTNRIILNTLLRQLKYEVIEAVNGAEAVELFESERPDIVLMDVMMPVMDGYEAVEKIKAINTEHFIPVIFLTGMTNEDDLAKCIAVGGDDFLTKPVNKTLLTSKIQAMERIQNLQRQVNVLYSRTQQDQAMAEDVFSRAVVAGNLSLDSIHAFLQPAEQFSGDVLLSAYSPSGDLNIMMGDFTGHGLAAALGAMPASEVFRAMTGKGFSTQQILGRINKKLLDLLPTNMFMATQFVTISRSLDFVTVANCGMPDILILDASNNKIKHRTPSLGMPLGIVDEIDFHDCIQVVKIDIGDKVILASDGVTEAVNSCKEQFTSERLEQTIQSCPGGESILEVIQKTISNFCGEASQQDDISLAEIVCTPDLLQAYEQDFTTSDDAEISSVTEKPPNVVDFSLTLHGNRLHDADPIPLLISHIHEIEGIGENRRLLFTILTELYNNALDHGVLKLNSDIKNEVDGFTQYFTEREKRLESLSDGHISISISTQTKNNGGEMTIIIRDSGSGFDYNAYCQQGSDQTRTFGRGIQLVSELCRSLTYVEPGNQVKAVYAWNNP